MHPDVRGQAPRGAWGPGTVRHFAQWLTLPDWLADLTGQPQEDHLDSLSYIFKK